MNEWPDNSEREIIEFIDYDQVYQLVDRILEQLEYPIGLERSEKIQELMSVLSWMFEVEKKGEIINLLKQDHLLNIQKVSILNQMFLVFITKKLPPYLIEKQQETYFYVPQTKEERITYCIGKVIGFGLDICIVVQNCIDSLPRLPHRKKIKLD